MSKNKSIVIISLHADPAAPAGAGGGGGTHSYLRELLVSLSTRQFQCRLITRLSSPSLPSIQKINKFTSIARVVIGPVAPIEKTALASLHSECKAAVRTVLETQPLVVGRTILHSVYWNSGLVAMELSEELGVPFVHTVISNGERRLREGMVDNAPGRIATEQVVFSRAKAIFAVSKEEKDDLVNFYHVSSQKIFVVGRPVDICFRLPAHDQQGEPRSILTFEA